MSESADPTPWPQPLDIVVTAIFLALVVVVPALGYAFMVLDFRAYLRSLRRFLVPSFLWDESTPPWVWRERTPQCLAALGLTLPCTEAQLLEAYREKVKDLHPDLGGDPRRFLVFQRYFEEALCFVRENGPAGSPRAERSSATQVGGGANER